MPVTFESESTDRSNTALRKSNSFVAFCLTSSNQPTEFDEKVVRLTEVPAFAVASKAVGAVKPSSSDRSLSEYPAAPLLLET